jgi:hypothetical protein
MTPVAYIFFSHSMDWACDITENPADFEGLDDWYLGGGVSNLKEVFKLLDEHDFDPEYFYDFVDALPHRLFNLLNKDGAY